MIATLDVGGTAIKRGVVDPEGCRSVMMDPHSIDATASADSIEGELGRAAASVLAHPDSAGDRLAVAFPGPFDYRVGRSRIRGQRKFDAIYGRPLVPAFRDRCGRPALEVRFCNDADAAAWGEARCGAGRGLDRFLMVTLGTGFGASLVDQVSPSGPGPAQTPAGRFYELAVDGHGRADDLLSGYGLARLVGVAPAELPDACQRARAGSGRQLFDVFGQRLGRFLAEVTPGLEVDKVLVGGGAASAFDLFESSLEKSFGGDVRRAALGQEAALLGAAALFI